MEEDEIFYKPEMINKKRKTVNNNNHVRTRSDNDFLPPINQSFMDEGNNYKDSFAKTSLLNNKRKLLVETMTMDEESIDGLDKRTIDHIQTSQPMLMRKDTRSMNQLKLMENIQDSRRRERFFCTSVGNAILKGSQVDLPRRKQLILNSTDIVAKLQVIDVSEQLELQRQSQKTK